MPNASDIRWFKQSFGAAISRAVGGTPFDVDQIVAIACQETGYIWSRLRRTGLTLPQITALCVGDTIDGNGQSGRRAFPRNKAALIAEPQGSSMFRIAREALVNMAAHIDDYVGAASNPDKFCRGFGIFQRDLQFFKTDPDYFLQRRYESFDETLQHCLGELRRGVITLEFQSASRLSDADFCKVAIAYNTGRYVASKGLKQGHFDGAKFYGEHIADFVALSRTVSDAGMVTQGGVAQVTAGWHEVIARGGLKLRSGPGTTFGWDEILPLGTQLRVMGADAGDPAWALVDLEGDGLADGHVFAAFLARAADGQGEHAAEPE